MVGLRSHPAIGAGSMETSLFISVALIVMTTPSAEPLAPPPTTFVTGFGTEIESPLGFKY